MRYLSGSKIKSFNVIKMGENDYVEFTDDKALISLTFEDGSIDQFITSLMEESLFQGAY